MSRCTKFRDEILLRGGGGFFRLDCGIDMKFVKHVLEFLILIYVCIKSDVI